MSNSFISLGRIGGPLFAGYAFDISIYLPYLGRAAVLCVGFIISLMGLKGREAQFAWAN